MALINCPECDRSVSGTARTCPHCGFDLKSNIEANRIAKEISEIPFPQNPLLTRTGILEIIVTVFSLVIGVILMYMLITKFHVSIILSIIAGLFLISIIQVPFAGKFIELMKEYNLAKTDFPEYQKQKYIKLKEDEETAQYFGLLIGISISGVILYVLIRLLVTFFFS